MSSGVGEGHGVETVWEGGYTEERENGIPLRCRAVTVRVNGVETVWEGGYGGARDRRSGQVSSGDGEGKWWKQYGKEGTEEREIGIPVRCRAVSVTVKRDRNSAQVSSGDGEGNGVETVWEGGYGGARDRNSGQVSSGDDEGTNGMETVWEGGNGGARDRNSGQVSSCDGEGKWGGNSMGRRQRRSARSECR